MKHLLLITFLIKILITNSENMKPAITLNSTHSSDR